MKDVPFWAESHLVGTESVTVDGCTYEYAVLSRALEPHLPGFVGFPEATFLFASEDVPIEFRPYILAHEVREMTELKGQSGRCLASLRREVEDVPTSIRDEYVRYRAKFFTLLVQYYQVRTVSGEFKAEIAASRDFLLAIAI